MLRKATAFVFAVGLWCSPACAQDLPQPSSTREEAGSTSPLSITSPRPGDDLSGAREVEIAWECALGEDIEYSLVYSRDGKTFDQEIASKLVDCEYTWQPDETTLAGWLKVKAFRDGYLMADSVVPVDLVPSTAILVSKADQAVFYLSGGELRDVFVCSTGLPEYDLKAGSYSVYLKQKKHWSRKWEVWMPHSMFFHEGYAIHATTVIRRLGRPASHGCIRLHPRDAEKLYKEVAVGTPVIVLPKAHSYAHLQSFFKTEQSPTATALAADRD